MVHILEQGHLTLPAPLTGQPAVALALFHFMLQHPRRAVFGSEPEPAFMVLIGLVALAANVACLYLIARHRDGDVHMRASWIFSKNDVIANVGVVLSGGIVFVTGSRWPDLFVGIAIAYIVFRGALAIIEDARNEQRENMGEQIAE